MQFSRRSWKSSEGRSLFGGRIVDFFRAVEVDAAVWLGVVEFSRRCLVINN